MPHQLEYVITGALLECSEGSVPGLFQTTPRTTKLAGLLAGNELDKAPVVNIPSFIICNKLTQQAGGTPVPCMPAPTAWQDTYPAKIGGGKALLFRSCIQCAAGGGKIAFLTSGQTPIPPELSRQIQEMKQEADEALAEAEKEKDAVGEAGFFEGMIPLWGSGRDLVHSVQTGDGWGMALNAGFLVWDAVSIVAGVLSLGTATAVMMGAKTGIRAAVKAAGKVTAKMAAQKAAQLTAKAVALRQGLKQGIKGLAAKIPKVCVMACFPAGTPIAVKDGYKNIEEIQKGDLVWAWNEQTGELALKPVVATMRKESDALVEIRVGNETIRATPEHPFWVDGQWKEAGELTQGNELLRSDGSRTPILEAIHHTDERTEVYNFEVGDWHTYFVGFWMWLVHNDAKRICMSSWFKKLDPWIQKLFKGEYFNEIMRGRYPFNEVVLENGKRLDSFDFDNLEIISRKFSQLSEVTEGTAKGYLDEIANKYKPGTKIKQSPSNLDGGKNAGILDKTNKLEGNMILEVPPQKSPIPQTVLDHANSKRIIIRDINGLIH